MEIEASVNFDQRDDSSEVEVFYRELGSEESPFFIQIYRNNGSERGIV